MIFDEYQSAVIALDTGRHKVFAPPGTGKTELLSRRASLAVERGVDPFRMACLTFTNRAARAMKERMTSGCEEVFVGNFHAFGARYLRRVGIFPLGGSILDEEDAHLMVCDAVDAVIAGSPPSRYRELLTGLGRGRLIEFLKLFANATARRRLGLGEEAVEEAERLFMGVPDSVASIRARYPLRYRLLVEAELEYRAQKAATMAIDFDDILNLTAHHLISTAGGVPLLDWAQVDEAQDLNAVQWLILQLTTGEDSHVVLLGDERQSIFSFMGSSLPRLRKSTVSYEEHLLSINYRSPPRLLRFFNHYAGNVLHSPPRSFPSESSDPRAGTLRHIAFDTDGEEVTEIAEKMAPAHVAEDRSVAILARTNLQAFTLSQALLLSGNRHFLVSSFDLFRTANAKDFMAFLSILTSSGNRIAWSRMLRLFGRVPTLKAARRMVNELFDSSVGPADLMARISSEDAWSLSPMIELVRRGRAIVFDVETTGLDPEISDIVQIAAVELTNGKPSSTLDLYLETDQSLDETSSIHGITADKLDRDGVDRSVALSRFVDFVGDSPLVAHNLPFDWAMLQGSLNRAGLAPLPDSYPRHCTLQAARNLYPRAPRHTLESLLEHLKIEGVNSHDALDDALATAGLLRRIGRDASRKKRRARRAIRVHRKCLSNMGDLLAPLLEKLEPLRREATTFGAVFDRFSDHVKEALPGYSWDHESDLRKKLIRHMDATCAPAPLDRLLGRHLHRYATYREPDLIMDSDRLVVSTVHRAKGLEFDTVVIPGVVENNYPYYWAANSGDLDELAEEARTFYVAITRARRNLIITEHAYSLGPGRPGMRHRSRFMRGMEIHFKDAD